MKPVHEMIEEITFQSFINDAEGAHCEARWEKVYDGQNRKFCVSGNSFEEVLRKASVLMADWEESWESKSNTKGTGD